MELPSGISGEGLAPSKPPHAARARHAFGCKYCTYHPFTAGSMRFGCIVVMILNLSCTIRSGLN